MVLVANSVAALYKVQGWWTQHLHQSHGMYLVYIILNDWSKLFVVFPPHSYSILVSISVESSWFVGFTVEDREVTCFMPRDIHQFALEDWIFQMFDIREMCLQKKRDFLSSLFHLNDLSWSKENHWYHWSQFAKDPRDEVVTKTKKLICFSKRQKAIHTLESQKSFGHLPKCNAFFWCEILVGFRVSIGIEDVNWCHWNSLLISIFSRISLDDLGRTYVSPF